MRKGTNRIVPVFAYWSYATLLHFGPKVFPSFFARHRIDTSQPKRPPNRVTFGQVLHTVMLQHAMQMVVAIGILVLTRDAATAAVWESKEVICIKVTLALFILDTWQYWWHRWMHTNRWLYRHIHSVHHRLTNNFSFGALYNHPLEGILMDMVGSGLAGMICVMPPTTACMFYTLATLKTVDDHCGYIWPWMSLIFSNNAAYHDVHHWGKGIKYNYSQPCFTFWDDFCGTRWLGSLDQSRDLNKAPSSEDSDSDSTLASQVSQPSREQSSEVESAELSSMSSPQLRRRR